MKSVLVNLFLLRKYICIYLFCYFYISIVAAEKCGFLYLKWGCYKNEQNKLSNGEICDISHPNRCRPAFTICISNQKITDKIKEEKCNVHYEWMIGYSNADTRCNHGSGNFHMDDIKKEIYIPVQKTYFVKIEARRVDMRVDSPLIASFGAEFNQIPSANGSQVVYKDIRMNRTDLSQGNPGVSLIISMGLQCDRDRYGEDCIKLCKPNSQNAFPCPTYEPKNYRKYVVLICGLFFAILVITLVMVFIACLIKKRRARKNKKLQQIDEKPITKKEWERIDDCLVPDCVTTFSSVP